MSEKGLDVVGIGNTIVDTIVKADDKFLSALGVNKGSMTLLNKGKSDKLFSFLSELEVGEHVEAVKKVSGGGAANLACGIQSLGGKAGFIGKVAADDVGVSFTESIRSHGVIYQGAVYSGEQGTGQALIVVTDDGKRTMCTYLGASDQLLSGDIDEDLIADAKFIYLTGFLWDHENGRRAGLKAIELAKKHDTKVAFTLADASCVQRHKDEFKRLIKNDVHMVFANRAEIIALFDSSDHDVAVERMKLKCEDNKHLVGVLTCDVDGAIIITHKQTYKSEPDHVAQVLDTTGAGSLFAAGFLYGINHGKNIEASAKLANLAAGRCIQQLGARMPNISELVSQV